MYNTRIHVGFERLQKEESLKTDRKKRAASRGKIVMVGTMTGKDGLRSVKVSRTFFNRDTIALSRASSRRLIDWFGDKNTH